MYFYGFHINANIWTGTDHGRNVIHLRDAQARIVRLPMFYERAEGTVASEWRVGRRTAWFSNSDVRNYITKEIPDSPLGPWPDDQQLGEVVLLSPEHAHPDDVVAGWQQLHHLCDWWPNVTWFYEIGNELNYPFAADPLQARWRVLESMRRLKALPEVYNKRNLYLAINQPSSAASPDWWSSFNSWQADGLGCVIKDNIHYWEAPNAPQVLTMHCYDSESLGASSSGYNIFDWTLGWIRPDNTMNFKITEAGIHVPFYNRGYRYVDAANEIERRGVKLRHGANAVMFYGTSPTECRPNTNCDPVLGCYGIRYSDAQQIGTRQGNADYNDRSRRCSGIACNNCTQE